MYFRKIKKINVIIIVEKLIYTLVNDSLRKVIHSKKFEWLIPHSGFPFRAIGKIEGIDTSKYRNSLKEVDLY
jgi:hypothetical protein